MLTIVTKLQADDPTCISADGTPVVTGLASAPKLTQNLVSSSGACAINTRAAFLPFKIPNFDDLKSLYYNQAKVTKKTISTISNVTIFNGDTVYYDNGNLSVTGNPTGTGTQVIFVNGKLDIAANYKYGDAQSGTVFIVKGNVNIDLSVTRIDAIIITEGTIYTAGSPCTKSSVRTGPLVINGSLISLAENSPPKFCRTLGINNKPAEKIIHQVKYLVILRNLLSDTFQRWSEIP